MSTEEVQLLEAIRDHLPEDDLLRPNTLRDRREFGELSETEHQELIRYEDLLEQQRVQRLEALIQLAKIRNIDPQLDTKAIAHQPTKKPGFYENVGLVTEIVLRNPDPLNSRHKSDRPRKKRSPH